MDKYIFTKKILDGLPIPSEGENRHSYADLRINGLIIRVTSNGCKSFQVYKKWQGNPIRVTIGKYPDISIENARKEASRIISALTTGKNPNEQKNKLRHDYTLKQAFDEYITRYAKKHKKTWDYDVKQFNRYLINWSNKKIPNIKRQEIEFLHNRINDENGLYAANRLLSMLKTFFNKAKLWEWTDNNPADGIKKFKEKSRDRFLQAEELPRFFKALDEETNTNIKDYIYMLLFTGARKRNVISMKWDEIDFKRKVWRIPETKNGDSLDIPIADEAISLLKRRRKQIKSEWVFPSATSQSGHLEEPKRGWNRLLKKAKIKNLRIHDIRRTLGSYQAIGGSSLQIIGKSLGHKSQQATQIYSRLNDSPVRSSINDAIKLMKGNQKNELGE